MYNNHLVLTNELKAVCIGTLLGDSSLQTQSKGKSYRLKFQFKDTHPDYVSQLYKEFGRNWIVSEPHLIPRRNSSLVGFQTLTTSSLLPIAKLFNLSGIKGEKKSISSELAENELTPKVLAYWFMDDGSKGDYTLNEGKQIHLNTHCFTLKEIEMLCSGLLTTLGLKAKPKANRGSHIILISGESYERFLELIDPYLVLSFRYRLPSPRKNKK